MSSNDNAYVSLTPGGRQKLGKIAGKLTPKAQEINSIQANILRGTPRGSSQSPAVHGTKYLSRSGLNPTQPPVNPRLLDFGGDAPANAHEDLPTTPTSIAPRINLLEKRSSFRHVSTAPAPSPYATSIVTPSGPATQLTPLPLPMTAGAALSTASAAQAPGGGQPSPSRRRKPSARLSETFLSDRSGGFGTSTLGQLNRRTDVGTDKFDLMTDQLLLFTEQPIKGGAQTHAHEAAALAFTNPQLMEAARNGAADGPGKRGAMAVDGSAPPGPRMPPAPSPSGAYKAAPLLSPLAEDRSQPALPEAPLEAPQGLEDRRRPNAQSTRGPHAPGPLVSASPLFRNISTPLEGGLRGQAAPSSDLIDALKGGRGRPSFAYFAGIGPNGHPRNADMGSTGAPFHSLPWSSAGASEDGAGITAGTQVVEYYMQHGQAAEVKLFYLNPGPMAAQAVEGSHQWDPYDLLVVEKNEVRPEHYTITYSGVVHTVPDGEGTVVSLGDFMREMTIFRMLRRMGHFKYHVQRKYFNFWKAEVRKNRYRRNRQHIQSRLFLAKPHLLALLQEVRAHTAELEALPLVHLRDPRDILRGEGQRLYLLEEFLEENALHREQVVQPSITEAIGKISRAIETTCEAVCAEERHVRQQVGDEAEQEAFEKSGVILIRGPQVKTHAMSNLKHQKLELIRKYRAFKEERELLPHLIKVADCMCAEALMQAGNSAAQQLLDLFEHFDSKLAHKGLFNAVVSFAHETELGGLKSMPSISTFRAAAGNMGPVGALTLTPSKDDIVSAVFGTIDAISDLLGSAPKPLGARFLFPYMPDFERVGLDVSQMLVHDEFNQGKLRSIDRIMQESFEESDTYSQVFEDRRVIYEFIAGWEAEEYEHEPKDVEVVISDLERLKGWRASVDYLKTNHGVGVLNMDAKQLKAIMIDSTASIFNAMREKLASLARMHCEDACKTLSERNKTLGKRPDRLEEFTAYYTSLLSFRRTREDVLAAGRDVLELYEVLKAYDFRFDVKRDQMPMDDLKEYMVTFEARLEEAQAHVDLHWTTMTAQLERVVFDKDADLLQVVTELSDPALFADPNQDPAAVLQRLQTVGSRLEAIHEEFMRIGQHQEIFNFPRSQNINLDAAMRDFHMRRNLWESMDHFEEMVQHWVQEAPVADLNLEEIVEFLGDTLKQSYRLSKMHKDDPVAARLGEEVESFKEFETLLTDVASPALQLNHWELIFEALGVPIPEGGPASFTFRDLLMWGLEDHAEEVENITAMAQREYTMLSGLREMKSEMDRMVFDIIPYKDVHNMWVVSHVDEVQQVMDDQLLKLQAMVASPFVHGIKDDIKAWESTLAALQELIDEWARCQSHWMYLEPIFSSDDIMKQMFEEHEKFMRVDQSLREIMQSVVENPHCITISRNFQMLETLAASNILLDSVMKGLDAYLERKRLAFPRFFFLSNEEILEILSETKEPQRVQPHLKKCFEGIDKLGFEVDEKEKDQLVGSMYSVEGEHVRFLDTVSTKKARGAVEKWLVQVEASMFAAVHAVTAESIADFPQRSRGDWVLAWPGMVSLAVSSLYWTAAVEKAIADGELKAAYAACDADLMDIVTRVRGSLTPLERITLGTLVVQDVHSRDVVASLVENQVSDLNDFNWKSQLRVYLESREMQDGTKRKRQSLVLRMMMAEIEYGYEYLGNTTRLVITPLTDRCYRTLLMAYHVTLGGSPEGPAGTGKTETTKDLAKAVARQCLVFNCSDSLDYIAMGKFFKGLAASGAWACLDEFNRIDLEVLSVSAQQIMSIQLAIQQKLVTFTFEGTELQLKWTCWIGVTMNKAYAGRNELPDNLKARFRVVVMMVPDYAMIAEIVLFSEGYTKARECAVKIVQCYRLCSEQLSSQDHYDYGMRAVIAVLRAAGQLKRSHPSENEFSLILKSIVDVNQCKFVTEDLPLFKGVLKDLFPGVRALQVDRADLVAALEGVCSEAGLQPTAQFKNKALQLYDMVQVRHGLMSVGLPYSGKTSISKMLARALTALNKQGKQEQKVKTHVINPKAVEGGHLYGAYEKLSHEWTDGILAVHFRKAANTWPEVADRHWLVLDGPVDAIWIENMNTVLDDNKKLCLNSGEIIKMSPQMTMMFEVADLAQASPATVSRCGMVFLSPELIGWKPLVLSWMERTCARVPLDGKLYLMGLFDTILPATIAFVRNEVTPVLPYIDSAMVAQLLRHLDAIAGKVIQDQSFWVSSPEIVQLQLQAVFLMAVTWSFGVLAADDTSRREFDKFIRAMLLNKLDEYIAPSGLSYRLENFPAPIVATEDSEALIATRGSILGGALLGLERSSGDALSTDRSTSNLKTEKSGTERTLSQTKGLAGRSMRHSSSMAFLRTGTLGRTLTTRQRNSISARESEVAGGFAFSIPIPTDNRRSSVYDFCWDVNKMQWKKWELLTPGEAIPNDITFKDIVVPTPDRTRYMYFLDLAIKHSIPTLFVGPTGVGKSRYIEDFLFRLDSGRYGPPNLLSFSARTTAISTQRLIDARLDKRRKGVYGPTGGRNQVIFVDDLNMPRPDPYGAQPPLELLRQFLDQGGWYQLKDNAFREIVDCSLVAAMGPTGGGRYPITMRLTRHFTVLGMTDMEPTTVRHIYQTLLGWHLSRYDFPDDIKSLGDMIVEATMSLYESVLRTLMPTPAKAFYAFNIRDVSRVFHAMTLLTPPEMRLENGSGKGSVLRLWTHELMRVFGDRLVDMADRQVLVDNIRRVVKSFFHWSMEELMRPVLERASDAPEIGGFSSTPIGPTEMRKLVFADFIFEVQPSLGRPPYQEIDCVLQLTPRLEQTLIDYNHVSKRPMNLALFLNAVEHVIRICRGLRLPGEHLLLIGVGGSGRQSLSRLATYIMGYDLFTVEVTSTYQLKDWRDDLKRVVLRAGLDSEPCVLLLSDAQLGNEAFVEDLNSLLNSADVPTLFTADERNEIGEALRRNLLAQGGTVQTFFGRTMTQSRPGLNRTASTRTSKANLAEPSKRASSRALMRTLSSNADRDALPGALSHRRSFAMTDMAGALSTGEAEAPAATAVGATAGQLTSHELWAYFVRKTAEKLHVVLCMSPVGAKFRERLRHFPSLINCCTIDTFDEWGEEALVAVGTKLMEDVPIAEDLIPDIVDVAVQCHLDSQFVAREYLQQTGRPSYVTPMNYTELFDIYRTLLERKSVEADRSITRLTRGIEKIESGAGQIEVMSNELTDLKPKLERTTQETQDLMDLLNIDKAQVEEKRRLVDEEVKLANEAASQAEGISRECGERLAEAMPAMESAIRALDTIKPADIRIIQSFKNPPRVIKLVIEAVVILLDIPPSITPDPTNNMKRITDYWAPALRMLIDPHFLDKLKTYDKDNIPPKIIRQLTAEYTCQDEFDSDKAARASSAAEGICRWVLALVTYDKVAKEIAPKRAALKAAEEVYRVKMAGLASKQAQLDALLQKLRALEDRLAAMEAKKAALEAEIETVKVKLERAQRLMGGLGGEMERWAKSRDEKLDSMPNLIGDMLLAAASISYLGPYSMDFRKSTLAKWGFDCADRDIPATAKFTLQQALGDPVEITQWEVCSLPNDPYSIENGLMAQFCKRYPLCVDPQKQASTWIRNMGKTNGLKAMRMSDPLLLRSLEAAIQYGTPMLVEEVGLDLDASLDPILRMQTFRSGGIVCIRLGESSIEMNPNFRLYMTSMMRNPHFLPDIWSKVTVINFTITQEGLSEQLLGVLVRNERPELEEQRLSLVSTSAANNRQLIHIEDEILRVLSESKGNILDDEKAIEVISDAKQMSADIHDKQRLSEVTQEEIERTRSLYRPCGETASVLYKCVSDLARLDHMYQFSMGWFLSLFEKSMAEKHAREANNVHVRLDGIERRFTMQLFTSVAQCLFRKDKALLALVVGVHLQAQHGHITQPEIQYLLLGPQFRSNVEELLPSRSASTLSKKQLPVAKVLSINEPPKSAIRPDFRMAIAHDSFRRGPLPTFTVPEGEEEEEAPEEGQEPASRLSAAPRRDTGNAARRKSITAGALSLAQMKAATAILLNNPPIGDWPTPQIWEDIVMLSEAHEDLRTLPSEVRKNLELWEEYAHSTHPENRLPPEPFHVPQLVETRRGSSNTGYSAFDNGPPRRLGSTDAARSSHGAAYMDPDRPIRLTIFQHLLMIRALRKDRLTACAELYVSHTLGHAFVEPKPADLRTLVQMSDFLTPVLFILTPGFDPGQALHDLAVEQHMRGRLYTVALGQGQGPIAEKVLEREMKDGGWVLLENCHLATSWMNRLEKIVDSMDPEHVNGTFRLWLSSQSTPHFPSPILERCIKVTNEAPPGLKATLQRSLATDPIALAQFSDDAEHPKELKRLLFGLCFVHAFVQERKNYGPIGWNIPYMFADGDLRISAQHMRLYLGEGQGLNGDFSAIRYTIGEINYGGRVTDELDRRLMATLMDAVFPSDCLTASTYALMSADSPLRVSTVPLKGGMAFARDMLDLATVSSGPEMFGLAPNADIQRQVLEAEEILSKTVLMTTGGAGTESSEKAEENVVSTLHGVLAVLPLNFNVRKVSEFYPVAYENSMNQVLHQELVRYNSLLDAIRDSLVQLGRAIQGLVVMSDQLEGVHAALRIGAVPDLWKAKSYPSVRSLASYIQDLTLRCEMFASWIEKGQPIAFWLPGFFFTHAFFTATLQNYARRYKVPIDEITMQHTALHMPILWGLDIATARANQQLRQGSQSARAAVGDVFRVSEDVQHPPAGVYVYGMQFEGCAWDIQNKVLMDPKPMALYSTAPVFLFKPVKRTELVDVHGYRCPVYKTPQRRGVLSTTGHSSSHVCDVLVPIDANESPQKYVLRGAALLLDC